MTVDSCSGQHTNPPAPLATHINGLEVSLLDRLAVMEERLARLESQLASAGGLRVGGVVRLAGLDNVAHLRLNGKKARLKSWEGPGGRWMVNVLQTGEQKSLKLENLVMISGDTSHDVDSAGGFDVKVSDTSGGGLSVGDAVEIKGLRRAGHLNGTRGEVLAWDDDGGRWVVQLAGSQSQCRRLRTCNLRRVGETVRTSGLRRASAEAVREDASRVAALEPGVSVHLRGLRAEGLNGLDARVQRWDAQAGRWVVRLLGSGEEKSLRAENLAEVEGALRAGQLATVGGLEQASHLNGLTAELVRWDADRGRWAVRVGGGAEEKSLRPESLRALGGLGLRAGVEDPAPSGRVRGIGEAAERPVPRADDLAELLGESGSDSSEAAGADEPALRPGAEVRICDGGPHDGRRATLAEWEDIGGPFGAWTARVHGIDEVVRLSPAALSLAAEDGF